MGIRLISHVNGDSDLVEAWLRYYMRVGVERFHLVVHGPPEENERLLAVKDAYPVTIESSYQGAFDSYQKKAHLDAVLARHIDQWVLLVDSDEFVEFPYANIQETIEELSRAGANVMAAPMLQRITSDGSLESPPVIDEPFALFPLCSVALYRSVGIRAEIFKFPLFFCARGTRMVEEGNHNPPSGGEPRESRMLGVTHHFKFRRTVSARLDKRINSAHQFRQESLQLREYLGGHANRLPLEGAFCYSRDELFRRGLLKQLPSPVQRIPQSSAQENHESSKSAERRRVAPEAKSESESHTTGFPQHSTMFVIPPSTDGKCFDEYILGVQAALSDSRISSFLVCFDRSSASTGLCVQHEGKIQVCYRAEPQSLLDWLWMIRRARPERIVLCYRSLEAFSWKAAAAAWIAGVRKRFALQYTMPIAVPPSATGNSMTALARRLFGRRTLRLVRIRAAATLWTRTVCASHTIRDALVQCYGFPEGRTLTVHEGVSTSRFKPSESASGELRERLGIGDNEFVLVYAASLHEGKGIEVLIHALSRALRSGIECKCIIVGDGPLKEQMMKKSNALGLFNYTFFEGEQEVGPYLQAGSAFILPSFWEGLPCSILKAMACGLPCIVTDVGGISEAVKDGITGIVIHPGSVDDAENAIAYLATHPVERAEMGRRARETVTQNFERDQKIKEITSVLLQ